MGSGFGMGYYLKLEWVSKKGFPGANVLNNLMTTREWEELTLLCCLRGGRLLLTCRRLTPRMARPAPCALSLSLLTLPRSPYSDKVIFSSTHKLLGENEKLKTHSCAWTEHSTAQRSCKSRQTGWVKWLNG